ncbi:MAG: Peptide-methionine (S)-S-oxide reductase [Bacteroidota bacterium]|jgi:peptide-methionine (S)-S-oxide reductase
MTKLTLLFGKSVLGLFLSASFLVISCGNNVSTNAHQVKKNLQKMDTITFGAGCFWCVEAVFQQVKGVEKVTSGYMGGKIKNPTYREVCSGLTGHAEVCQIIYDPQVVSVDKLLEIFWQTHDPTTLNRQGNDVGTQYRSAVFFHNAMQGEKALAWKNKLNAEKVFPHPIVTEIVPAQPFYPAEDYHQNYFNENGEQPYCQIVIKPKMDKFLKQFKGVLK